METSGLLKQSFSPLTVIDIRYGPLEDKRETNQMRVTRFAEKYGIAEQHVKLIMGVDDDHIDGLGRIWE